MTSSFKCCAVPFCPSTTSKTPLKLFINVPKNVNMRKTWLNLARRNLKNMSSTMYYCEDHFNLPADMENYEKYRIMGSVRKVRLKPNCLPSKFSCQPDRGITSTTPCPLTDKRHTSVVEEAERTSKETVIGTSNNNLNTAGSRTMIGSHQVQFQNKTNPDLANRNDLDAVVWIPDESLPVDKGIKRYEQPIQRSGSKPVGKDLKNNTEDQAMGSVEEDIIKESCVLPKDRKRKAKWESQTREKSPEMSAEQALLKSEKLLKKRQAAIRLKRIRETHRDNFANKRRMGHTWEIIGSGDNEDNIRASRCATCFSGDRDLHPLKEVYYTLLKNLVSKIKLTGDILICYECKYLIRKIDEFRKRVLEAQALFGQAACGANVCTVTGLSRLKTKKVVIVPIVSYPEQTPEIQKKVFHLMSEHNYSLAVGNGPGNNYTVVTHGYSDEDELEDCGVIVKNESDDCYIVENELGDDFVGLENNLNDKNESGDCCVDENELGDDCVGLENNLNDKNESDDCCIVENELGDDCVGLENNLNDTQNAAVYNRFNKFFVNIESELDDYCEDEENNSNDRQNAQVANESDQHQMNLENEFEDYCAGAENNSNDRQNALVENESNQHQIKLENKLEDYCAGAENNSNDRQNALVENESNQHQIKLENKLEDYCAGAENNSNDRQNALVENESDQHQMNLENELEDYCAGVENNSNDRQNALVENESDQHQMNLENELEDYCGGVENNSNDRQNALVENESDQHQMNLENELEDYRAGTENNLNDRQNTGIKNELDEYQLKLELLSDDYCVGIKNNSNDRQDAKENELGDYEGNIKNDPDDDSIHIKNDPDDVDIDIKNDPDNDDIDIKNYPDNDVIDIKNECVDEFDISENELQYNKKISVESEREIDAVPVQNELVNCTKPVGNRAKRLEIKSAHTKDKSKQKVNNVYKDDHERTPSYFDLSDEVTDSASEFEMVTDSDSDCEMDMGDEQFLPQTITEISENLVKEINTSNVPENSIKKVEEKSVLCPCASIEPVSKDVKRPKPYLRICPDCKYPFKSPLTYRNHFRHSFKHILMDKWKMASSHGNQV